MTTQPVYRLHDLLEAASQRINRVARTAAERTVEGLGLTALASDSVFDRDAMLGAQFELNRRSAMFALAFGESLNLRLRHECAPRDPGMPEPALDASAAADRFVREVRRGCEPELRELEACIEDLLGPTVHRNPLRPETLSHALRKGVDTVSANVEIRELLHSELGRMLALEMRDTYDDIIADMREAGIAPTGLGVHPPVSRGLVAPDSESMVEGTESLRAMMASVAGPARAQTMPSTDVLSPPGGCRTWGAGSENWSQRADFLLDSPHHSRAMGQKDGQEDGQEWTAAVDSQPAIPKSDRLLQPAFNDGSHGWAVDSYNDMPSNLIRAHRDELRRAANGGLDHVVIDFIGSLFDQSLGDAKVPPQVVRQIARLQLPMLRAALVDPATFASRMHPLRRLVTRITALAAVFEHFDAVDDLIAQQFFGHVKSLATDLIDGEFAVLDAHERKLGDLEQFVSQHMPAQMCAAAEVPASMLSETETEQDLQKRFADELAAELQQPTEYAFLHTFLTEVWSRVLVQSAIRHGSDTQRFMHLRSVAHDLCASVRPKANLQQRQEFLTTQPRLVQGLKEGMDLVSWPEPARKAFFGALLPAHAESLKVPAAVSGLGACRAWGADRENRPQRADFLPDSPPHSPALGQEDGEKAAAVVDLQPATPKSDRLLDWNPLVRQIESVLHAPLNQREDVAPHRAATLPVLDEVVDQVAERDDTRPSAHMVDIDLGAKGTASPAGEPLRGTPAQTAALRDATENAPLQDRVAAGSLYRMLVDGTWLTVKLTHVSPGRSFFVFTHGRRYEHTISLTQRMLARLCEGNRFKDLDLAPKAPTADPAPVSRDSAQPLAVSAAA